jgi:hypothetical protein
MRRLLALLPVLFLFGCQDSQPFSPNAAQGGAGQTTQAGPAFWLSPGPWNTPSGELCTATTVDGADGSVCNGVFYPLGESNTDLYPVVEICKLVNGVCTDKGYFVREPGGIEVENADNGKYLLGLNAWLGNSTGTFRIIVGITFTGGTATVPEPGWDTNSDKVLGWYDHVRTSSSSSVTVQFRIASGALCEQGTDDCVVTSFDPEEEFVIVLDDDFNRTGGLGVVGMKFPPLSSVTQERINLVLERIELAPGQRCLPSGYPGENVSGKEYGPCYHVRTEPYIDLKSLPSYTGPGINFGVCLDDEAASVQHLLRMLKWSSVKERVDELEVQDEFDFFDCQFGSTAPAPTRRLSSAGGAAAFALLAARSLLLPAPLHARRSTRLMTGELYDFSNIILNAPDSYETNFMAPITSTVDPSADAVGPIDGTLRVRVVCITSSTCGSFNAFVGTAGWNAAGEYYQTNWNTPRSQAAGEYRVEVVRSRVGMDDDVLPGADVFSIRSSGSGPSYYTHNSGRTLPIKFFLSAKD